LNKRNKIIEIFSFLRGSSFFVLNPYKVIHCAGNIALSLAMYLTLYAALLSAYVSVVFYLAKKATVGSEEPRLNNQGLRHV